MKEAGGLKGARRSKGTGGRPTRQESERRLKRLLDIARRRFLAAGYRGTSLEGIAREAKVAKKTLYHRFGNKAGLFAATVEALRESWIAELRNFVIETERPKVVLEKVALHLLEVGTRPDRIALQRLMIAEAHRAPGLVNGRYEKGAPRGMEPLAAYFRAASARHALKLDDIPLATEQFTQLVLGGIRMRLLLEVSRRPSAADRRRIARQAVHLFLSGCRGPAAGLEIGVGPASAVNPP